jgi:sugar lactone lactonase YvrE
MKRFLCAAVLLAYTAASGSAQDIPLSKILVEGEGWKVAAKDVAGIKSLEGRTDPPGGVIWIKQADGTWLLLWPDGRERREEMKPSSRVAMLHGRNGATYYLQKEGDKTIFVIPKGMLGPEYKVDLKGLVRPTCIALWPDEAQLVVGDAGGKYLWTARVEKDGSLSGLDRYYSLRVKPGEKRSGVKAMVMDAGNLLYAATPLGVQVFDPTGRLCGVILPPAKEEMTAITIGGKDADTLFVACGDKIYSRKIQGKAAYTLKKDK